MSNMTQALAMSPATMAQLQQQMQAANKSPQQAHLSLVRNIREAAVINSNGGGGGVKPMMAAPGLVANLSSCRLEARQEHGGQHLQQKSMEIQNHVPHVYQTVEDEMDDVEPPPLALTNKVGKHSFLNL